MQHLDDGLLHALVDGEVPSSELGPIQAHLTSCADCRVRLDEARAMAGESNALIELIEVPASGGPVALPAPRRRPAAWIKPIMLAASLGLAVAIGYAGGARQGETFVPAVLRVDTLYLSEDGPANRQDISEEPAAPATVPAPRSAAVRSDEQTRSRRQAPAESREAETDQAAVPAAPTPAGERRDSAAQRRLSSQYRLEELVVTSSEESRRIPARQPARDAVGQAARALTDSMLKRANNEGAAKSLAAAPQARLEEAVTTLAVTPISFTEAVALLGGQLKLIEGMVPARLESSGTAVRVVYVLERGELILQQRREADSVSVTLIAPALSPDSLAKLRQKIR
jgi:hypothetical protein